MRSLTSNLSSRRGSPWTKLSTVILAAALALTPLAASAQVAVDELEVHLRPTRTNPQPVVSLIPIRNEQTTAQQVRILVGDWTRDTLGQNLFPEATGTSTSCGSRLQVFPTTLQVPPGATEMVRVSYTPAPADTGCWAIAYIETVKPPTRSPTAQGSFLTIEIRTGVKIYVHRADAVASGEVRDMRVAQVWRQLDARADTTLVHEASVWFANTGTAHLRVRSSLELRSATGELLRTVVGPEAYMTPGSLRVVRIPMPDLGSGAYVAIVLLDYDGAEIAAAQADFRVP